MDFDDTPVEAAIRIETRRWLAANAPAFELPEDRALDEAAEVASGRAWLRHKHAAGYSGIRFPKQIGGRGGSVVEAEIFAEEEAAYRLPRGTYVNIGLNMALPVILAHGTSDQIERFVAPTLRGDLLWCQLFSEPAAGSDLAALRCRAERDGDAWRVNGQKVWSSWAHRADWGLLIVRTDASVPKHKGLTFFVVDMRSPGIEVRPIRQISGASDFNETFLADVRIPDACRIGPVGGGWRCAMTVLTGERLAQGRAGKPRGVLDLILRDAAIRRRGSPVPDHTATRQALALAYAEEQAEGYLQARLRTKLFKGESPGALSAIIKLAYANRLQKTSGLAMEVAGLAGLAVTEGDDFLPAIWEDYVWSVALRIAGGADEVLRNQLAEQVLGMPGEMRLDKDVPFTTLT